MFQVCCIMLVLLIATKVMKHACCKLSQKWLSQFALMMVIVYFIGYMYFTFFSRTFGSGGFIELRPFYVYTRLFENVIDPWAIPNTFVEKFLNGTLPVHGLILNILLYYPLGYLLPILFPKLKPKHVILIGCLCSIATEATQYLLKMGWCETDDVIHNTLGTAIGVWIWHLQSKRLNTPKSNNLPKD